VAFDAGALTARGKPQIDAGQGAALLLQQPLMPGIHAQPRQAIGPVLGADDQDSAVLCGSQGETQQLVKAAATQLRDLPQSNADGRA
jgi:hypothetical protein